MTLTERVIGFLNRHPFFSLGEISRGLRANPVAIKSILRRGLAAGRFTRARFKDTKPDRYVWFYAND
jgi:hypothetical protein